MENLNIQELSDIELMEIDGGAPSKETSFGYDIGWCLVTACRINVGGLVAYALFS